MTAQEPRARVAALFGRGPEDAVGAYYALEHDARRTRLFVHPQEGAPRAVVAVCQTGLDLFRPLIVVRGEGEALREALRQALVAGRGYLFSAPLGAQHDLLAVAEVRDAQVAGVHTLPAGALKPVINLLTTVSRTPDGQFRAVIRGRDGAPAAEAGTSWVGARYAEVFVRVREGARGRGLGKSVLSAVCVELAAANRNPLFVTGQDNGPARGLATRLGFVDTGAREWTGALALSKG